MCALSMAGARCAFLNCRNGLTLQTQALKNLGLDITRAEIKAGEVRNRFYVTDAKV